MVTLNLNSGVFMSTARLTGDGPWEHLAHGGGSFSKAVLGAQRYWTLEIAEWRF